MEIRELMTGVFETLPPTASVRECAERMREIDVGFMPIQDNGKTVGVVTDRDLVLRAIADGMDPSKTPLQQVMSGDLVSCHEQDDVQEAMELMEQNQVRRLLVLDGNDQLVGILSLGDLATALDGESMGGEVLGRVSDPSSPALL
ncbi:MAG: CBS domain-containing protein [Myxococcaceae bacterium]